MAFARSRTSGSTSHVVKSSTRPQSVHTRWWWWPRVLREAGLVIAEEVGRERRYHLNAAALARLHRDWFARFIPLMDASLGQLKRRSESAAVSQATGARRTPKSRRRA